MEVLSLVAGLTLLAVGGETLVRAAVSLARRSGLPVLLIGITVVGAATSMPELVVSVQAAAEGNPGIAVGNVLGSNIANLALGLGVMGVLMPFTVRRRALGWDLSALMVASTAFLALGIVGTIGRATGALMLFALGSYLWLTYRRDKRERDAVAALHAEEPEEFVEPWSIRLSLGVLAISVVTLVGGARLLLDGAIPLAEAWGVSDAVIGASVVAIGTSLPEIATTAAAALRREHEVALGNLVGSSLFNLLGILGMTALVKPIPLDTAFVLTSGAIALGVVAVSMPWLSGRLRLGRIVGAGFLAGYVLYITLATGLVG
ncbi:MAG: calcium/sodium antiporter [Coriobacteriia bacterium]